MSKSKYPNTYRPTPGSTTTGTLGASAQVTNGDTSIVRIVFDTAGYYELGVNPTASASTVYLPAGVVEYVYVRPGEKIAVFGSGGNYYVTECDR